MGIVWCIFIIIFIFIGFEPFSNFDYFMNGEWPSGIVLICLVIIGCWAYQKINEFIEEREKKKQQ